MRRLLAAAVLATASCAPEFATSQCQKDSDCTHGACVDEICLDGVNCSAGFAGDGERCVDVDECAAVTHNCAANASCANSAGGFTCTCKDGFTGDGVTCFAIDLGPRVSVGGTFRGGAAFSMAAAPGHKCFGAFTGSPVGVSSVAGGHTNLGGLSEAQR